MRLSPLQRKELAEELLVWLRKQGLTECENTYNTLLQCSEDIDKPLYDIWKAYALLRIMGRIELKNPNGKHGFRVLSFTPLSVVVIKTEEFKRSVRVEMLSRLLSSLKKQNKAIWDESLRKVEL